MTSEENVGKSQGTADQREASYFEKAYGPICVIRTTAGEFYGRIQNSQQFSWFTKRSISVYKPLQLQMVHTPNGGTAPVARSVVQDAQTTCDTIDINVQCVLFLEPIKDEALGEYDVLVGDKAPEKSSGILVATQDAPKELKLPPGTVL